MKINTTMTPASLFAAYVDVGIIQFGRFARGAGGFAPVAFDFLMLPSFPVLLDATAQALVPLVGATAADRLLTTRDAVPLGGVLAVKSGIPLTYPYGEEKSYTKAYVIEGAYDVGHPTALLTNTLANPAEVLHWLEPARAVGLNIQDVVCVVRVGAAAGMAEKGITVRALFDFGALLDTLELPAPLREEVRAWLAGF